MPHYAPLAQVGGSIDLNGTILPEYRCNALALDNGMARQRAVIGLKRRNVDVMVASSKTFWGASAYSGSGKQTFYTTNTRTNGDRFLILSNALATDGVMGHDTAYVEVVGPVNTCKVLKHLGLDLPEDLFGTTLHYQINHDEFGRTTSYSLRTSCLIVKVLTQETMRLNIPLCDHTTATRILISGEGENRRVEGVTAIDETCRDNPRKMVVIRCQHLVLVTGGPGELHRDSVYPVDCFSALGMALEVGITLVNLTESQSGIGTPRNQFPWNLSDTYMQAIPCIYSQDHPGRQYNFLVTYYPTARMLVSAISHKGYQWPFHAERMLEYGSSLLDVAVYEKTRKRHDVFLDFPREPEPVTDGTLSNPRELDDDIIDYLQRNHALLVRPLVRLVQMNPLAIRLYQMHGHDLIASSLKSALNNQHLNDGVEVDIWACTSLTGCYAAGENAGTHGVTHPDGAASNAGQVFTRRCALHTAHQKSQDRLLER